MSDAPRIIIGINEADVLLGRGKRVHTWEGNIRFRTLCEASASSYLSTTDAFEKDAIVHKIISTIQIEGGRFLREEYITAVDGTKHEVWVTVPMNVIRTKVKQACRDTARVRVRGRRMLPDALEFAMDRPSPPVVQRQKRQNLSVSKDASGLLDPCSDEPGSDRLPIQGSPSKSHEPNDRELLRALLSMHRSIEEPMEQATTSLPGEELSVPSPHGAIDGFSVDQGDHRVDLSTGDSHLLPETLPFVTSAAHFLPAQNSCKESKGQQQLWAQLELERYSLQHSLGVASPFIPPSIERHHERPLGIVPHNHPLLVSAPTPAQRRPLLAADLQHQLLFKLIREKLLRS